ncbi:MULTISPECIES: GNAT family N-acetyltransferase [Enterobacter]|uniref:GNAT family N-acetyltransferase n=1 Tax=Enterobacter TaxID=547 RepID=UPI00048973E7|nr:MULTISPECIES: GNAT family N-acetyltransferase [Enterobacter cloacae complex]MCD2457224.1 GNAT family N-acetyltransferase [Enterobacter cloacae complex sp. 2021EL-01261]HDT2076999.1 GNAT family N-acetyltransferase [Enterobacter roggenkampii]HDT2093939.1 GNAT family N-acetyltransferase [Enterobacter roggenkampii]HEG2002134.1 GNAT family N-acetyltransferase [Enterobacter asburiae]
MITIKVADLHASESQRLIENLSSELAAITGDGGTQHFNVDAMMAERTLWVVAKNDKGDAVGCAALRPLSGQVAELKRMYSDRSEPGIGQALLAFLEASAQNLGYGEILLETRKVNRRAVNFYERNGYSVIDNYGPYIGRQEAVCFAKKFMMI